MAPWPASLRARLTLWYTILLALPLVAVALASYFVFSAALARRTDRFISDALVAFSSELTAERRTAYDAADAMRSTIDEVRFRDLQIAILDGAAAPVAVAPLVNQAVLRGMTAALVPHAAADTVAVTINGPGGAWRILSRPLDLDGRRFRLTGANSLADIEDVLARLRAMFFVAIPVLVACAATGGFLLARKSLEPVAAMSARAARITASSLDQRLPVMGGEELAGLARIVNDLLDRLEQAFAQQRRFVADASHELRTPTAIIRTEGDVTLSRDHRPEAEYRASIGVIQDAARRLTRIVEELFLLARSDAGHLVARKESLYLEDVVHTAARAVQAVAEQRGVRIELGDLIEAPVEGDADLLGRLLLNLLDNAIRHSPAGGVVRLEMAAGNEQVEVSVTDQGPGVPAEARAQIFERFFRVDSARSRAETSATSGAGLGLAIARRIAEMHAGQLVLAESGPGRTRFRLAMPISSR